MKRIAFVLSIIMVMAFSSVCLASDSSDLNKQQSTAQMVIDSFGKKAPAYNKLTADFDASLKNTMDEKTYASLQKQVKDKFGDLQEVKFYSFERFDAQDRVTYLASFSSQKVASIVFAFNKDNKLTEFGIFPQQVNEAQNAKQ